MTDSPVKTDNLEKTNYLVMTDNYQSLIPLVANSLSQFGDQMPITGLSVRQAFEPSGVIRSVYQPSLCVVLQGEKISELGERIFHYQAGQCLLAAVDVPVRARIIRASQQLPYLAFRLVINPTTVAELLLEQGEPTHLPVSRTALQMAQLPEALVDPLRRLFSLLSKPNDLPVLAPLYEREIVWQLLNSELREDLRLIGWHESYTARIGQVTRWMRQNFGQAIRVSDLATMANMSVPSFHRHFKAVTQMSPVQFQKQIRLQTARQRLLARADIAEVGYSVGYESPSQFSRDYRKFYGVSPSQDRQEIKTLVS